MFIELGLVETRHERRDEAAFPHHAVGARECVFTDRVEHNIDIFGHVFEFLFRVIDRHIGAELLQ